MGDHDSDDERLDCGEEVPDSLNGDPTGTWRFRRRRRTSCCEVRTWSRCNDSAWLWLLVCLPDIITGDEVRTLDRTGRVGGAMIIDGEVL